MYIHNPFAASISMTNVDFDVWWAAPSGSTIFVAHARARDMTQVIAAGTQFELPLRLGVCLSCVDSRVRLQATRSSNASDCVSPKTPRLWLRLAG